MSSYMTLLEQNRVTGDSKPHIGQLKLYGEYIANSNKAALDEVMSEVDDMKGEGLSRDEIKRRMKQMGESLKGQITQDIDKTTDEATDYISGLSGKQQLEALGIWARIGARIASAFAKALEYIGRAIRAVLEWVSDMWEKVKSCLSMAKQAFVLIFS